MKIGVELKQKQTLILTQELRQSINILQYSSIELNEFLQQQTLENPVLEIKEKSNEPFITRNRNYSSFGPYNKDLDYDPINQYSDTHHSLERHLMEQINTIPEITSEKKNILLFLIGHLNRHGFLEIEPEIATKLLSVYNTLFQRVYEFLSLSLNSRTAITNIPKLIIRDKTSKIPIHTSPP
jgi:RNA polymerase sigma-54 factor